MDSARQSSETHRHHGAPRTPRLARFALSLICLAGSAACSEPPSRVVVQRAADSAFRLPQNQSTDAYTRRELGSETRVVCGKARSVGARRRLDFRLPAVLSETTRIEFGAGFKAAEGRADQQSAAPKVQVWASAPGRPRTPIFDLKNGAWHHFGNGAWHHFSVEVRGWEGAATLEFVLDAPARAFPKLFLSCPTLTEERAEPRRKKVILVSLDTLRADRLPLYGYERATAPELTRIFGNDGLVVERTFSQGTDTLRGHTAMLFGLNPSVVRDPSFASWARPHTVPTLADLLRARGYRTAAFTENAFVSAGFRFANGFERYQETRSTSEVLGHSGEVEATLARGLEWIRDHKDEAFFVFLHTYQVHAPYDPPEAFAQQFRRSESLSTAAKESDRYDAEIAFTDARFGDFVDELHALGILDETVLIVTSDHGEEFGEHGGREHGATLHNEVLQVPMLLRAPGLLPSAERREGPMSLVDLMPTLMDLLSFPVPNWSSGRSLLEHWQTGKALGKHRSFAEAWAEVAATYSGNDPDWIAPGYAITEWPYRLSRFETKTGHRYELFDLAADPKTSNNLFSSLSPPPASVAAMKQALDAYPLAVLEAREGLTALQSKGGPPDSPETLPAIAPAVTDKLRNLGYIE